jgi:hypothetical protein
MDERPFPHGPLPQAPPSRRGFLVVGGLALVFAGAGAWVAVRRDDSSTAPQAVADTSELAAAAAAERALIARIDLLAKHPRGHGPTLAAIRADHVAHHAALLAARADLLYPQTPPRERPVAVSGPAPRLADLRGDEQQASHAAARRAAKLSGRSAALLASIAASEAIHAELLR